MIIDYATYEPQRIIKTCATTEGRLCVVDFRGLVNTDTLGYFVSESMG